MEKYTADMHIHSNYSFDCKMPLENIVKKEIENGVKVIAVTDHVELDRESLITVINKLVKRNEEIISTQKSGSILINTNEYDNTTLMRFYHIAKMNGFELWEEGNSK